MSCILHIETSTSACSVAISNEGENVFEKKDLIGPSHNVSLGVFVELLFSSSKLTSSQDVASMPTKANKRKRFFMVIVVFIFSEYYI